MSQVLYRKWRPQEWDQVVGQDHVIHTLRNAVSAQRVSHANLFAGPRGTGKTTTARLLAKAVNCLEDDPAARPCNRCDHCVAVNEGRFLDMIEIDAASNTSVEDVRDLRDKINFSPNQGRYKVYIIDEVHMLSTAAFNALLKTLEEPPAHAIFVLATTEVHKIPATVLSRCQRHEFRRIPVADIEAQLEQMAAGEGLQVDPEALTLIARQSTGSLRDAISLLDQLSATGEQITLEIAQAILGTATNDAVLGIVEALLKREAGMGLDLIHRSLDAGSDPRQLTRQIVDYLRDLLLVRMGNASQVEATTATRARMAEHAQTFTVPVLLNAIRAFNAAAVDSRLAWRPALPLELAFIECLETVGPNEGPLAPRASTETAGSESSAASADAPAEQTSSPAAAPEISGDAVEAPLDMQRIQQTWRALLDAVRERNPQTQGLLNSCKPMGLKNGVLILGFASDLIKTKMEKSEHLDHAKAAFAAVLGVEVPLQCVVSADANTSSEADLGGLDQDGMVAVALRDLGGEIVDIQ